MIKKILCLILCAALLAGCRNSGNKVGETKQKNEKSENLEAQKEIFAMDTYMTIKTYGDKADEAAEAAVDEITRLDKLFSTGNNESEIAILNESGSEILSKETFSIVEKSCELYKNTAGAFNIAVYPLMKEWGFTNEKYNIPDDKTIKKLLKYIDVSKIEYDANTRQVVLPRNYEIDLGGIAKGYTSARLMQIFKKYGLLGGIVSLGGNVQTYGYKSENKKWKVAVENPETSPLDGDYLGVLDITDKAVITSGGYERYFEKNGKRYHHILNPKTGKPADSGLISVSIISSDGTLSDGLSTSLFIMGKQKGIKYWQKNKDKFDVVWLENDGTVTITDGIEDVFSSDFKYSVVG